MPLSTSYACREHWTASHPVGFRKPSQASPPCGTMRPSPLHLPILRLHCAQADCGSKGLVKCAHSRRTDLLVLFRCFYLCVPTGLCAGTARYRRCSPRPTGLDNTNPEQLPPPRASRILGSVVAGVFLAVASLHVSLAFSSSCCRDCPSRLYAMVKVSITVSIGVVD